MNQELLLTLIGAMTGLLLFFAGALFGRIVKYYHEGKKPKKAEPDLGYTDDHK